MNDICEREVLLNRAGQWLALEGDYWVPLLRLLRAYGLEPDTYQPPSPGGRNYVNAEATRKQVACLRNALDDIPGAWATATHISLSQVVVDAKSNEITAGPKLQEIPELTGALVTIDAMGCQTQIVQKIVAARADYCLAVKANQRTLHRGRVNFFAEHLEDDFARVPARRYETEKHGHGRHETRSFFPCPVPPDLPDAGRWPHSKAIGVSVSHTSRGEQE